MTTLHLGVLDVPYTDSTGATKTAKVAVASETTGDVAGYLEAKYHVMEHFFELHGAEIAEDLVQSLSDAFEDLVSGAPAGLDPFGAATSAIEQRFREMLTKKELDALGYPGIPTKASLEGVNHRLKSKKGAPRPSFIDTGQYQASFKAWID